MIRKNPNIKDVYEDYHYSSKRKETTLIDIRTSDKNGSRKTLQPPN